MNDSKICRQCKISKDLFEFYKSTRNRDGYENSCKTCKNKEITNRQKNYKNLHKEKIISKKCPKCKIEKDINQFNKNNFTKSGYDCWCRGCRVQASRKNSQRIALLIKDTSITFKICPKCKQEMDISYFKKNNYHLDGYDSWCNPCINERICKEKYGITLKQKKEMIINQNYKCLSCGLDLRLLCPKGVCIDHDHVTGKIRGILCSGCNRSLGLMKENPDKIYKLYLYALNHCSKKRKTSDGFKNNTSSGTN
jgi:hypothetical protein